MQMDDAQQPSSKIDDAYLVEQLVKSVDDRLPPVLPLSIQLWNAKTIAAYLQRSPAVVLERVVTLPGFPIPVRLPSTRAKSKSDTPPLTDRSTGQALWKAIEVIGWVDSHRQTRVGRPRNTK